MPEAGAPEIEVTPAMISAGSLVLAESDPRIEGMGDVLPRVFRAMLGAKE
jgi:hypothetical protein